MVDTQVNNEDKLGVIKTKLIVKKLGDSYYVLLTRDIRELLHIENGAVIGAKLWNIETKSVVCPKCKYQFEDYIGADPHDCPSCGEEFLDVNAQEMKGGTKGDE